MVLISQSAYSQCQLARIPTVIVGVLQRPALRNLVRMASVMDPYFLSRRRVERISDVL